MGRIDKLITNNSGYSSKNFALIWGVLTVIFVCISFMGILYIDLLTKHKIESDLIGLATLVGAFQAIISAMVGWFFYEKVKSEQKNGKTDNKIRNRRTQ